MDGGEEDEQLVAAVRAGADLEVIAEQHGRTRDVIVSRLLRMIPARQNIPEEEPLGWIMARLADPCFDWRTPLAHPRPGKRGSGAPATPPASDVGEVLDIWQRINGSELGAERRARFLASPAPGDLVQFPADVLWERGRRLYQAHGRLLLNDWAAECAVPGLADLPDAGDLRKVLARTGESVRRLVAAAVAAVPDEGDREVLERRLGLSGAVRRPWHRSELTSGSRANGSGRARTGPLRRSRPRVPARDTGPRGRRRGPGCPSSSAAMTASWTRTPSWQSVCDSCWCVVIWLGWRACMARCRSFPGR